MGLKMGVNYLNLRLGTGKYTLRRIIAFFLCIALVFSVTGCGNKASDSSSKNSDESDKSSSSSKKTGKNVWIDSEIAENAGVAGNCRLQDDFAAAANAEWLKNEEYSTYYGNGTFAEAAVIVNKNKRAMLDDKSLSGKNLELLRTFDELYDWDYRNEIALKPIEKYLAYIDEINSIDDVSSYMLDNSKNPFATMLVGVTTSKVDTMKDNLCLTITQPKYSAGESKVYFSMTDEEFQKLEDCDKEVGYILGRLGYSDAEIKTLAKKCHAFENKMADINYNGEYEYYQNEVVSKDELIKYARNYPLNDLLEHYKLGDEKNYTGDYKYLKGIGRLYTEKNVEAMKAYFKYRLINQSMYYLDKESMDKYRELYQDITNQFSEVVDRYPDRAEFLIISETPLKAAMDQAYLDTYFDERTYNDIVNLTDMIIAEYKSMLKDKDWISEENKESICKKLDNICYNIIRPSNEPDFGDMQLMSKDEGGTLLDALCVLNRFKIENYTNAVSRPLDRSFWDIYSEQDSTTEVNAFYSPWLNSLCIDAGILCGDFYSYDWPLEQKLGRIGVIIGHEISHAFDSNGVYYNEEGDYKSIIEGNDMSTFSEKASKVDAYYDGYSPFEGAAAYNTSKNRVSPEAIADMGGMKCALNIAKKQGSFDYDLFFRSFASLYKCLTTKSNEVDCVNSDPHPLQFLRINVTVQQFDEFYETYDVKPGDNMYLAPEDRIAIW